MVDILYIKDTINEINNKLIELCKDSDDSYKNEIIILNLYPDFYDKYPFLVKKICKRDDLTILYKMIDSIELINEGKDTISNVEHNLGQELAEKYLDKQPKEPK